MEWKEMEEGGATKVARTKEKVRAARGGGGRQKETPASYIFRVVYRGNLFGGAGV